MKISLVSGSTRIDRQSHRIALALQTELEQRGHDVYLIDLLVEDLGPFEERFSRLANPKPAWTVLNQMLMDSDCFLFLSPEYNGSISSSLKNFIDLFAKEPFMHKAIGVVTGSVGAMGGIRAAHQLQLNILGIHGFPHPQMLTVGKMQEMIDEAGHITDESYAKKQSKYLDLFLDFAEKIRS